MRRYTGAAAGLLVLILLGGLSGCAWWRPAPKPEAVRVKPGVVINGLPVGGKTASEVQQMLAPLAAATNKPPHNACFDPDTGAVQPSVSGKELDVVQTSRLALQAPAGTALAAVVVDVPPAISTAALTGSVKIGHYATRILDQQAGRIDNIRLGARVLNNTVVYPGGEFSFNRIIGEPTAARGYQPAKVIGADGAMVYEEGGGLCQLSSTLYNAVRQAGLPVTERHAHSVPVQYVPPGCDATTYTDKDFRFVNNTSHLVIIRLLVKNKTVEADLFRLP